MIFGAIVISATEKININGYKFDSIDKESIKITTGTNIINIYYTKRTDLSYIVNYLEKDTNTVLKQAKTVELNKRTSVKSDSIEIKNNIRRFLLASA